jgi:protein-ribulosamine 3-kinase
MLTDTAILFADIAAVTGMDCSRCEWRSIGGGDINEAWQLTAADGDQWFLKLNKPSADEMLAAEYAGLQELANSGAVRVPHAFGFGATSAQAWLLLEWLSLGPVSEQSAETLGRGLAEMHRITAECFGWHRDNTIGSTPQRNPLTADWVSFYRDARIGVQLELAAANGASATLLDAGYRLMEKLAAFFVGYEPQPALLHGDLWGGNRGALIDGTPVIFDPAVYFGDREADIAMTRLFGGFSGGFYEAYNQAYPLDAGYADRVELYNLYHVLNHYNLFGGGYHAQAEGIMQRSLAKV